MTSIVRELQSDSLDRNVGASDLMRKALVIARKLKVAELEKWLRNELEGYGPGSEIPEYRAIRGTVQSWNPFHGWLPVTFEDPEIGRIASKRKTAQPIAELEALAESQDGLLIMPFPEELGLKLMRTLQSEAPPVLLGSRASILAILDAVRNIILNWALRLEDEGVLGEGLSFSSEEQRKAGELPGSVNYFYGQVGVAQIQQSVTGSAQTVSIELPDLGVLRELAENLIRTAPDLNIPREKREELRAEAETIVAQTRSPKPKHRVIQEAVASARNILEGATGSALAAELMKQLGSIFGM
jgi:AbiTii-like protein